MKKIKHILILCLLFVKGFGQVHLSDLKVESKKQAIGLDIEKPRFSWKMLLKDSYKKNVFQKAYQIIVKNEKEKTVWDTGKVISDKSINIAYAGESLQPGTRYNWHIKVWDQEDKTLEKNSFFETGIMTSTLEGWEGAKWIGGNDNDLMLYSHALTVFKMDYKVKLDKSTKSAKAGFVFGANDVRLMNKNLNILGVENQKDESYLVFQLDISELKENKGEAKLHVFRSGYDLNDNISRPLFTYHIPTSLINHQNKYNWHQVALEMNFGKCLIYIDGYEKENLINNDPNVPEWVDVRGVSLNPLGDNGGDLIVYPALADIGFNMKKGEFAYFKEVRITNYRKPSSVLFQENLSTKESYKGIFEDQLSKGLKIQNKTYKVGSNDHFIILTANPSKNATPLLRTTFNLNKKISKATMYVTARGIYEMYVNGYRVGDDYFNPGLTQYNKTHMYQTYDVTTLLQTGKNIIGSSLGEGWWSGNSTYRGFNWNYFGDRQSLLLKLKIQYSDGTTKTITSNNKDWKVFTDGPIRYSSFFQGELYDARKETKTEGWKTKEYNDSTWHAAVEIPVNSNNAFVNETFNYNDLQLIGQIGENAKIVKTLQAKSVEEVRPGVFIYDMGQNMVGVPRIKLKGSVGDTITMRYAEMKYPDLLEYSKNVNMIMTENIRGAMTTDRWILKNNSEEIIQPHFTFHGYRFLEVTGINKALPLENVEGLVLSSIQKLSSSYKTSNNLVNKLWENITWSFRSNFLSIPTDTPARNERMGWNGDINVFAKTATYLGDVNAFLERHLIANRNLQEKNGRFPDIAPIGTGFGGTLWGSAGVTIPWTLYQQYGDKKVLENHYGAMKAYVDFLSSKQDPVTGILDEGPLGDWLSPEGYKNDNSLFWTAYQIKTLEILFKTAAILGKEKDASKYQSLYQKRKAFFNNTYVDVKTKKTTHSGYSGESLATKPKNFQLAKKGDVIDTQASYAIPLNFNVFNKENRPLAEKHLVTTIERKNKDYEGINRPEYSLMTGFIGTAALCTALSKADKSNVAYELLQQTNYPSWLYSVVNGATTIWERLNSYTTENGFGGNNSMNSFNHYSFGAVGEWMYAYSLGIQPLEPGYKKILIKPTPDTTGKMTWAEGYYDSMYGRINSKWEITKEGVFYFVEVPPNTTAEFHVLCDKYQSVYMITSNKNHKKKEGLKESKERKVIELGSGSYQFLVK
ncbi:family 78 glycoside hydrolase catalytic domain [Wenyingzhuangia sp. chi5]|uniref:alpha-L-rhamnosidase n=1 Tax=Wenyingzhuangia gilva TaxID=3057677 RepID=A0ABT8VQQ9_9FLAO|nr:family 78 glycoside hydrolase catalytic domain [Wenyingzhuangia sp. chi5]MDO3694306.1 family 78 glycoside hydrolase catalytic domain [Wenyingzhuangia sp. chi5]